jgi:hypothetical protein
MAQAPDMSSFIRTLVSRYPTEWQKARTESDDGSFNQKVAEELYQIDKRWGRNAKRNTPGTSDLSKDVVAYYLGPEDIHIEAYDFIIAHASSAASIGWGDITDYSIPSAIGMGRYVQPFTGKGYDGPPVNGGGNPMITTEQAVARLQEAGITINQTVIDRAHALGWDGGGLIAVSIVNQLISEFSTPSDVLGEIVLPTNLPAGTKIKLVRG